MKITTLTLIGKILAALIILLGIIHDTATFTPIIQGGLYCLAKPDLQAWIYMSLVCGTSFVLCGLLIFLNLMHIRTNPVLLPSSIILMFFLLIAGILSVIYMIDNPFAWIAAILSGLLFLIIITLKNNFKKTSKE